MTARFHTRRSFVGGAAVVVLAVAANPARAVIVFDPANYAQNLLTAARELQQVQTRPARHRRQGVVFLSVV